MPVIESAGSLLREARRRAGITQTQLAQRAGTTQSAISAYESGRRQPSLPVLLGMLAATGHVLEGSLVAAEPVRPAPLAGVLGRRVHRHRREIASIAARYGARAVRVFGSVARGTERTDSDIDLLIDLPAGTGLFALGGLRRDLEGLLLARVDVVSADGLKPEVRARIDPDLVPVSRYRRQRLLDVQAALDAIDSHLGRGDVSDGLVFDAVRVRLIEIGEAVKALPRDLLEAEPDLPWSEIARMRDQLAHRYFDTTHAIVASTVTQDLPRLREAITRLLGIAGED